MMKKLLLLSLATLSCLFGMSLETTIQKALVNNNNLKIVIYQKQQSKAIKKSKQMQNYGQLNFTAGYDHYNLARTLAPLTPMDIVGSKDGAYQIPSTKDLINSGISYNVVLFDGYAQKKSFEIADIQHKSFLIKENLTKEDLVYNVKNLYVSLLSLQDQLQAQKLFTTSQKQLYIQIQSAYKFGKRSKLDMLKAKNSYLTSLSIEEKIKSNIEILKATLQQLIGGENFDKAETVYVTFDNKERSFTKNINNLQKYEIYTLQSGIAQKKIDTAKSAYYPKIDFNMYYGYNFGPNATTNTSPALIPGNTPKTYIEEGDWNSKEIWQAGIHLKWNIYDFGMKSAVVQKEELNKLIAITQTQEIKLKLQKDIKIAQSKKRLAQTTYKMAQNEYELALEISNVEQTKYDNNAATITDLLQAQAKAKLLQAKQINAKYDYLKAQYALDYLLEKGTKG